MKVTWVDNPSSTCELAKLRGGDVFLYHDQPHLWVSLVNEYKVAVTILSIGGLFYLDSATPVVPLEATCTVKIKGS